MTKDEALKLALEALKNSQDYKQGRASMVEAVEDIEEALAQPAPPFECRTEEEKTAFAFGWWKALETRRMAQPVQKPDIYPEEACDMGLEAAAYYTTPPEREWVELTDASIQDCYNTAYKVVQGRRLEVTFARAVLAKSKELNT